MLELKKITKVYETEGFKQRALDNISVNFRSNEFTSILGPSGSGKTTLLNIIGGLDHYTSGDLIINEVSTKNYKDSNWDSYRNHRIGFVFQNYNLIAHQNILSNVTLALTLSGMSKKDAVKKAKSVLDEVGLTDHIYKKPNQLSGGQMQRVAIARALINDPDILLADEPTGALDSETSVNIMNLLKKIANNKLVIMVTHNPELANEYSNRIITLKDGKITSDTNPYDGKKVTSLDKNIKIIKNKKTSMSVKTAISLSFNNLMTKKGRTILVSLAASIGIIGIALILSLSTGFQNYIDKIQEDTLSSYPLMITSETADMTSLLLSMVSNESKGNDKSNIVKEEQFLSSIFSNLQSNDLKSFNYYLKDDYYKVEKDISSIKYTYSVSPMIYTIDSKKNLSKLNPSDISSSIYSSSVVSMTSSFSSVFTQMINDEKMINEKYDVLAGHLPQNYDEMIIVLSEPNAISDMLVYSLGLRDTNELSDIITNIMTGEEVKINNEPMTFTYEELMNTKLKLINQTDIYKYNKKYDIYEDMSEDDDYMMKLYEKAMPLKIVGIVAPKEGTTSMALSPGVSYSSKLIDYIINQSKQTNIVKKQLENTEIDVFSDTRFDSKENNNSLDFQDLISVDTKKLKSAFGSSISEEEIKTLTEDYMKEISTNITADTSTAKRDFLDNLKSLSNGILDNYISNPKKTVILSDNTIPVIYINDVSDIVNDYLNNTNNQNLFKNLESKYVIPSSVFMSTYNELIKGMINGYVMAYYQNDPSLTIDPTNPCAILTTSSFEPTVNGFLNQALVIGVSEKMAQSMVEAQMQKSILANVGKLTGELITKMASAFKVEPSKIASAFKFDLSEEELKRIMTAMMSKNTTKNATSNLMTLGYQNVDEPTAISLYFNSFESKENFIEFLNNYNEKVEKESKDKVIHYTDTTGLLMSSVKTVVDSVSYVLIAFVSISLVVSSIMIGVITYISVLERTKEIGILRAIGASKMNISSIFNAETFIIGLLSGVMGITISLILIIPINYIIHTLTDNMNISAVLPVEGSIILVILSVILTIIGGLIPASSASKKDPVEALRSE